VRLKISIQNNDRLIDLSPYALPCSSHASPHADELHAACTIYGRGAMGQPSHDIVALTLCGLRCILYPPINGTSMDAILVVQPVKVVACTPADGTCVI
jgi:hypothetical protein